MSDANLITSAYGVKKQQTPGLVRQAIQLGFRGIDTACQPKHYNEAGVGAGIAAALNSTLTRADLYLQTKFTSASGQDPHQIPYEPSAPLAQQVAASFKVSLRNLQTDYVDCLVLHSPLSDDEQSMEVWHAMEAIFDAGGARQLGISNCYSLAYLQTLYHAVRVRPAVVQNRFYADTQYDRAIRSFCISNSIIYQSFWTLSANPHVLAHATTKSLAFKYEKTPAQVLFRYLTQQGVVPLIGTKSEVHMQEDLEIFEFQLSPEELTEMDSLFGATD
jgi:diketogulonate reductase-like aldo/keto reductase